MKHRWAGLLLLLGSVGGMYPTCAAVPQHELSFVDMNGARRMPFNEGWRFFLGDAPGAERLAYDDSTWKEVRLPHDWAIEGPFDPTLNPHTGALPVSGLGWYRHAFTLVPHRPTDIYTIEFDGAMSNSQVWLNGHALGGRPYGYSGFVLDLTRYLRPAGQRNVLTVKLAPLPDSSRWYPGAGIYRNVWLDRTGPIHVDHWGTFVSTPQVSADLATVSVQTRVLNRSVTATASITMRSTVLDAEGRPIASTEQPLRLKLNARRSLMTRLQVSRPRLWDVNEPYLYSLLTEVVNNRVVVDRYVTTFGIRTLVFDHTRGFILNGRSLKLQGVCLHHDLGALGAAVNRRATERQLQIMKAAGVNAIRTSHNPPSPELLHYADRLGLLVIDEAFDMWRIAKVANGYSRNFDAWSERDLRDMIRRDRNHPSILLWSMGNEVPEQGHANGWKIAKRLTRISHEEDPTRPTTAAFDNAEGAIGNGLAAEVDIPGFNYKPTRYADIQRDHPDWIIYGSETASCVSSRGVYHLPLEKYAKHPSWQLSSYDIIAPAWAYCPDVEFAAQENNRAVLGEFVWTGFDYLGEPTPYFGWQTDNSKDWPAHSSYFGMVDLAGFPKDRYYLYQSVWTRQPMVHVLPHWNWLGHEGQIIPVMVYSNADEVELFLNGKSLGRKSNRAEPVDLPVGPNVAQSLHFSSKYRLQWDVPYQSGRLQAIAYRAGAQVARDTVVTAGPAERITLVADRTVITADGDDLSFITVRVEDKDGNLCPAADDLLRFKVTGAGEIAAVDNGNAASLEAFRADVRRAFNGLALLVVRSTPLRAGVIDIRAEAQGLIAGVQQIRAEQQALP